MLASQFKEKVTDPLHPLNKALHAGLPPRLKKQSLIQNSQQMYKSVTAKHMMKRLKILKEI